MSRSLTWVTSRKAPAIEGMHFGKKDLNGLSFNSQSLREWACQEGEKKWSIDACIYSYNFFFFFLCVLSFSLFFLSFLSTSPSFSLFPYPPFIVDSYPFLYHLTLWDLPFLSFNCFWLLTEVLPRLPTGLSAAQPLPLLKMCWLHHFSFPDKIACLVSYLSLFSLHSSG